MYGYGGPYDSTSYTTIAQQPQAQNGGLLGGIPGGGAIPGMLNGGYNTLLGGGGASGAAGSSMAPSWLGPAGFFAAMIGLGKNLEYGQPRTAFGQGLLAGLAPSGRQIMKDPVGMGLPTLFGMPFLTPFTSSKEAQAARPEWQGLFKLGT